MFIKFKALILLLFFSACYSNTKDKKIEYFSKKLGPKFDLMLNKSEEQVFVIIGDKACNGCVDIALDKIYQANVKHRYNNIYFLYPDYYLKNLQNIPENILIDSIQLVSKTQFLSYFTVLKIKDNKIEDINHLTYLSVDSLLNSF